MEQTGSQGIRVAVVEDNPDLLDDVSFHLERAGFQVEGYPTGEAFEAALSNCVPRIVVLDLGLPGKDGLAVAGTLRKVCPDVAVVMLTARVQLADRVRGLEQGADTYLCKPVDMAELVAVVRARARALNEVVAADVGWAFDSRAHELHTPCGVKVPLTSAEATVIWALAADAAQQVTRDALIAALGGDLTTYDPRRLEAIVSRLRKKVVAAAGVALPLRARRNQGYTFFEPIHVLMSRR